jgi:hypothetical protein
VKSLQQQHLIAARIASGSMPKHLVYPLAFENHTCQDSLMMWHPGTFKTTDLLSRPDDPTYAAMVFRESPGSQRSLDSLGQLFTVTGQDYGKIALTIRVKDAWITCLLAAWFAQRTQDLEPGLRRRTVPLTAGIVGNTLNMLIGNSEAQSEDAKKHDANKGKGKSKNPRSRSSTRSWSSPGSSYVGWAWAPAAAAST